MRTLQAQYFLTFAVMGASVPYVSLLLRERGMDAVQIGSVQSVGSLALLLSPVLVTMLGDTHVAPRRLLTAAFLLSGLTLAAMAQVEAYFGLMIVWLAHNLAFTPMTAVQDGLQFAVARHAAIDGRSFPPYHAIRVWGTYGFMAPSIALYFLLQGGPDNLGLPVTIAMWTGVAFCLLGVVNSLRLPAVSDPHEAGLDHRRLPTLQALVVLARPRMLSFCIAIWLAHVAAAAYYAFFPLYLEDHIGVSRRWIGLIMSLGVLIEVVWMLGFGLLSRRIGLKGVLIIGLAGMALRHALLASFPHLGVALASQIFHGASVLLLFVAPPIHINDHASPAFRQSIQGVFVMLVAGTGRLVGYYASGLIAKESIFVLFAAAALLAIPALVLILVAVDRHPPQPSHPIDPEAANVEP